MCNGINDYLALRSFIVGYNISAADLALWGQLQGDESSLRTFLLYVMPPCGQVSTCQHERDR